MASPSRRSATFMSAPPSSAAARGDRGCRECPGGRRHRVDGRSSTLRSTSHHTAPFARLSARYGAYFVTGNSGITPASARDGRFERLGLRVLEPARRSHARGARVVVAGVADFSAHHFNLAVDPHYWHGGQFWPWNFLVRLRTVYRRAASAERPRRSASAAAPVGRRSGSARRRDHASSALQSSTELAEASGARPRARLAAGPSR
jgi:hypothetical protein